MTTNAPSVGSALLMNVPPARSLVYLAGALGMLGSLGLVCSTSWEEWPLLEADLTGPSSDLLASIDRLVLYQAPDSSAAMICIGDLGDQADTVTESPGDQDVCVHLPVPP